MTTDIENATSTPQLLCTRQSAAACLEISQRTLDTLIATKELRAVRIGRSVRIPLDALKAFVRKSSHPTN
jgi:excisionase family DNA binding protein